jgi:hypothetical protein
MGGRKNENMNQQWLFSNVADPAEISVESPSLGEVGVDLHLGGCVLVAIHPIEGILCCVQSKPRRIIATIMKKLVAVHGRFCVQLMTHGSLTKTLVPYSQSVEPGTPPLLH